jgi:hypothetical protein
MQAGLQQSLCQHGITKRSARFYCVFLQRIRTAQHRDAPKALPAGDAS